MNHQWFGLFASHFTEYEAFLAYGKAYDIPGCEIGVFLVSYNNRTNNPQTLINEEIV